jgi:hypothetical protein
MFQEVVIEQLERLMVGFVNDWMALTGNPDPRTMLGYHPPSQADAKRWRDEPKYYDKPDMK